MFKGLAPISAYRVIVSAHDSRVLVLECLLLPTKTCNYQGSLSSTNICYDLLHTSCILICDTQSTDSGHNFDFHFKASASSVRLHSRYNRKLQGRCRLNNAQVEENFKSIVSSTVKKEFLNLNLLLICLI